MDPILDGGALTCTSSNTGLSISSEAYNSASPAVLLDMLTMLSPRTLVIGLDPGSISLPSRLGRLSLTSFDDMAVVGIRSSVIEGKEMLVATVVVGRTHCC